MGTALNCFQPRPLTCTKLAHPSGPAMSLTYVTPLSARRPGSLVKQSFTVLESPLNALTVTHQCHFTAQTAGAVCRDKRNRQRNRHHHLLMIQRNRHHHLLTIVIKRRPLLGRVFNPMLLGTVIFAVRTCSPIQARHKPAVSWWRLRACLSPQR